MQESGRDGCLMSEIARQLKDCNGRLFRWVLQCCLYGCVCASIVYETIRDPGDVIDASNLRGKDLIEMAYEIGYYVGLIIDWDNNIQGYALICHRMSLSKCEPGAEGGGRPLGGSASNW